MPVFNNWSILYSKLHHCVRKTFLCLEREGEIEAGRGTCDMYMTEEAGGTIVQLATSMKAKQCCDC